MKKALYSPTPHEMALWGITLLLIPFLSLLLATVAFMSGGVISAWMFPAAIVLSLAIGYCLLNKNGNPYSATRYCVVIVASMLFALLSSALIYDHSYDGNTYHQEAIFLMEQGWNPFHNPTMPTSLWEKHYAKSLEIVASTIAVVFNRIEYGKAVNILLILASLFITTSFLRREFPHKRGAKIALLASLLALCPIVIRQAYTYYNDYPMYTFMLLTVIALTELYRNSKQREAWIILIVATLFAAVTKFTIGFYVYLTLAIGIIWIFVVGKHPLSYRLAIVSVLLIIAGYGILGYHPYVTNTIGWGNPFYPLIGSSVDIMSNNTPELYASGNRFSNLIRSLFYNGTGTAIWVPFVTDSLRDYYISYDSHIAGFSPLFVYALLAAILLWAIAVHQEQKNDMTNRPRTTTYGIMALLLILCCFIFEQSWWMRYVPFLWAVPVILLLYTEYCNTLTHWHRGLRNTCYALLLFIQLLCCGAALVGGISFTLRLGAIYHAVTPQSKVELYNIMGSESFNYKLQERGIEFEVLESNHPSDSTMVCIPFPNKALIYLDATTASRIDRSDLMEFVTQSRIKTDNSD